jgi:guanylate kinase
MEQIIREIIREKIKNVFKEAKQVGTVYHFTTPENFEDIIQTDRIIGFTESHYYKSPKGPRRQTGHQSGVRSISLTRNKDFHKDKNYGEKKI